MTAVVGTWLARADGRRVVHRLILWLLPWAITRRFRAAAAADLRATLELVVGHPSGPASYELAIAEARCTVRRRAAVAPAARAAVGSDDLIRASTGAAGWPELLSAGRLELTGDPFMALRFAALFGLPVGRGANH